MSRRRYKEIEILTINKENILPGESSTVNINVGRLPSGTRINMPIHVFRSKKPGPTVLLLAGVHGDEINGIETIRQTIFKGYFDNLNKGCVIAIPVVNIYGFINFSREVPDGKDVNRSFPGSLKGSLASRVARIITGKILPHVNYIIDLHTGGGTRFNYPQIRYSAMDSGALELAKIFAPPFVIKKPLISKSLRKTANLHKIPVVVYEAGESLRFDGPSIQIAQEGILRVTNALGLTSINISNHNYESIHFSRTSWVRASLSGLFMWTKCSGHRIRKGEPIGIINDPQGVKSVTVLAPKDGFIIGHNNASVVNQGDALFHIGFEHEVL